MKNSQPQDFPEIVAVTLSDRVIAAVKDSFFSGLLKPGDRIVERQLAEKMGIGTPAIREALITLREQGFLRRVTNTATHVVKYSPEDVEQLYSLRVELEVLSLQWGKLRHTEHDLQALEEIVHQMVGAADSGQTRRFYEQDLRFHRHCWQLCRNRYLADALERVVPPLFAFVLAAGEILPNQAIAREHYGLVTALRNLKEPEFTNVIRSTLSTFSAHGVAAVAQQKVVEHTAENGAQPLG